MSYYDVRVTQIPIGWMEEPRMLNNGIEGLPVVVYKYDLPTWQKAWRESGVNTHLCRLEISDNGNHGDGIHLTIFAGDPKMPLVETSLPDESLDTLIAALKAIRALRKAED